MFRLKSAAALALFVGIGACTGDAGSPLAPDGQPQTTISDAAHAGTVPGFYFLPPMVPAPSYSGTFDAGVQPRVEICELAAGTCATTIATYTRTSGTGGHLVTVNPSTHTYQVNWHTNQFNLDPARHYRISVYVGSFQLGFADVDVVSSGKELKNVNTQEYIPLQDDRTLPIKFRIETGIVAQVIVTPDSASVPAGGTQQFTATVLDLHGNPVASPTVTWSSSNTGVATVDGTGLATGVAIGTATVTATSQAASGSATLAVFNPNTPPVAQDDAFEAIGNVTVPVAAPGVLGNDTDGESNPLQAVAGTFPTTAGGSVTMNADGGFSYLSAAGFTGEDSFVYMVTDGQDSVTATVTMTSAYRVWYVDNAAAAPGDGRDASPFNSLAGAEGASTAGETIFVRTGNAPYDGGFALKTGQSLTGQGVPANVTATLNGQTVVLLATGSAPTITKASGATITLAANNVVQGVAVTSAAGAGIAGTGFGTLTVGSTSVAAAGGPALDLTSGDVVGAFGALSSAGSTGAGLRLVGVGGSFSAANGSITGSAGAGAEVTGGSGTFTYGGDIAVAGPLAVQVTGQTGGALTFGGTIASTGSGIAAQNNSGGTIAFTGSSKSLSTGANAGVSLANNGGATISFAGGGLVIGTTTGTGFEATGGGTVSVTGAGNTVASAGGVAVRVDNTTIGAAGITFRSVSANGGSNGIVLNNTGALNGMQVTGTGAAGSGGTIKGTSGDAVSLENARNVELSSMTIQNNAGSGIRGANVTGFQLDGSTVTNNGDDAAADEAGIRFDNLLGTSAITGSTVSGSVEDNVRVLNTSGTLSFTVSASTFGANSTTSGRDGLFVEGTGSAVVNVSVQGSHFTGARASLMRVELLGSSQAHVVLATNTFHNTHPAILSGSGGVALGSTGSGAAGLTYSITGNSFRGALGAALTIQEGTGAATFVGTISGNTVGAPGVANSGSVQGSGINLLSTGAGTHTVAVTGNQIRQYNNQGLLMQIGDASAGGDGTLNATVTGNVVAEPGTVLASKNGIHLNAGLITGDNPQVCLDLGGVGALANSITGSGSGGAAGTDFRLRQRMLTTVRLPGYAGANSDNLAVTAFVQARNGGTPTGLVQNTVSTGGGGYVGGAGCPQP